MKLILNGGGSGESVKDSYKLFSQLVGNKKVLYIPLAWYRGNMENCIDWFKGEMKEFGITDIVQVLNPNEITQELLMEVGGVFIGGGNTYQLLKLLKESPAYNNLKNYIENDGVVMGVSAGALIMGKSIDSCLKDELEIKSCNDENLVGLIDTDGFGYLGEYSVLPHYKKYEEQFENIEKRIEKLLSKDFKLICVPEETSLYITDSYIQVIGKKSVEIVNNKERLQKHSNEKFEI